MTAPKQPDGGPVASPSPGDPVTGGRDASGAQVVTLRDHFAGEALKGMLASIQDENWQELRDDSTGDARRVLAEHRAAVAQEAYAYAAAMLVARERR